METKKEDILIEILQRRIPCSKEEARYFLQKNEYNLISALDDLQQFKAVHSQEYPKQKPTIHEEFYHVSGRYLKNAVKSLLRNSNMVHITILRNQRELLSLPITAFALFYWIYPFLSTLSIAYLLNAEYTIRILRTN